MAMGTYLCTTTYSPVSTNTTISKTLSFPLQPRTCMPTTRHHSFLVAAAASVRKTARVSMSAASAASSAVQVDVPAISSEQSKSLPFRVGHGFDLHRLELGYPLIIGGINVPHEKGCEAHSDGDVLLHCVVDAILGALGLPDIGQIFPDSDPKWKGAPSSVFIKESVRLMHEAGYEIGNLDATLILQLPKLSPFKEAIRASLSELLGADPSVVNLKAKTHEKVDSLGENRSIAAHTVVLLMKK
uniref:2-C-methyl-D-erythritol 2,4-cyclodiphosphate synthase n=1 Tax=Rhizophora mucronata TaxID=61149 RepID=A0A2P2IMC3_RHIMU